MEELLHEADMDVKKVSLIVPCYNGEGYLGDFLDSVLAQTYPNIELILVNDGSTDGTEEVFLQYSSRLETGGVDVKYIRQGNGGPASAVNAGLKIFSGEYLMWPDSDDVMMPEHIEKEVRFLEEHPECAFVQCAGWAVPGRDLENHLYVMASRKVSRQEFVENIILEKDLIYCPVAYMVRSDALKEVIPELHVFESMTGQNIQMLLPLAYRYECGYLPMDEPLFCYSIRTDSLSHRKMTRRQSLRHYTDLREIKDETLKKMGLSEAEFSRLMNIVLLAERSSKSRCLHEYFPYKQIDGINHGVRRMIPATVKSAIKGIVSRCRLLHN